MNRPLALKIGISALSLLGVLLLIWNFASKTDEPKVDKSLGGLEKTESSSGPTVMQTPHAPAAFETKIDRKLGSSDTGSGNRLLPKVDGSLIDFKQRNQVNSPLNKIRESLYGGDFANLNDVVISYRTRAVPIANLLPSGAISIGEYNGYSVFSGVDGKRDLEEGQLYVAYDGKKQAIAFATGRLIVDSDDSFDEQSIASLNLKVDERLDSNPNLLFLAYDSLEVDFDQTRKHLSKIPGVRGVRLELIYTRYQKQ